MRWRLCLWKQKTCCLEKQNPRIGSPCTAMSGPGQRSPGLCSGGLPPAQQMPKREWSEPSPGKRTMTHTWSTKSPAARQSGSPGWRKSPPYLSGCRHRPWPGIRGERVWKANPATSPGILRQHNGQRGILLLHPSRQPSLPRLGSLLWLLVPPLRAKDRFTKRRALRAGSLPQKTVGQTNHLFLPSPREIGNTAGRI